MSLSATRKNRLPGNREDEVTTQSCFIGIKEYQWRRWSEGDQIQKEKEEEAESIEKVGEEAENNMIAKRISDQNLILFPREPGIMISFVVSISLPTDVVLSMTFVAWSQFPMLCVSWLLSHHITLSHPLPSYTLIPHAVHLHSLPLDSSSFRCHHPSSSSSLSLLFETTIFSFHSLFFSWLHCDSFPNAFSPSLTEKL